MSNQIQIFDNPQFGEIRILDVNGEPTFCLSDLCKVLELTNPSSVKSRLDESDVQVIDLHALNYEIVGNSMANFVNESGFYEVILQSSSPKVRPFKKWITKEVLPSIRKNGGYIASQQEDTPELIMARALEVAKSTLERHKLQLEEANHVLKEQAPVVQYYNEVLDSKSDLSTNMIAQCLGMSAQTLNKILCEKHIQYRESGTYFLYAKYRDMNYAVFHPHTYLDANGMQRTKEHLYWTQRGKQFIMEIVKPVDNFLL